MMKKVFYLLIFAVGGFKSATAQRLTPEQYVETYKDIAIKEMRRMGVPAAITLAQGLLETESGNSDLVKKSNNHFGIKCKSTWTAETVTHDDDAPGECFRSYKDAEASFRDHSNYLRGTERYAFLFALKPTDYKGWAKGLRKAGYATNPKYPEILIKNIEQYNLEQYTLVGEEASPKIEIEKSANDSLSSDKSTKNNSQQSSWNNNDENTSVANASSYISNGHKFIHAEKGTSLLAIASENNIDLSKLLAFNDLQEDGILKNDQIIFLQKKSKTGDKDFYIAQEQESPYDVAQKNGIQLKYLLSYNNLSENAIIPAGTKLFLNPAAAMQQATAVSISTSSETSTAIAANKIHSVQPKEGLYTIAKSYKVSVQQLREWNKLTSDDLKIGQQLIVSK